VCTVTGLVDGTAYTFTASALTALGASASSLPSAPVIAAVVPSRPSAPVVSMLPGGVAVLGWAAPVRTGGLDVSSYVIASAPAGHGCTTDGDRYCTVYGLTPGVAYSFSVTAITDAGASVSGVGSSPLRALS
jgi:hypothetical protein